MKKIVSLFMIVSMLLTTVPVFALTGTEPEDDYIVASSYSTDMSAWSDGMSIAEAKTALGLDEIVGWSGMVANIDRTITAMRKTDVPNTEDGNIAAAFVADALSADWIPNSTAGLVKNFSAEEGKVYISFDIHIEQTKRTNLNFLQLTDSEGTTKTLSFGAHTVNDPSRAQTNWGYNGGVAKVSMVYDLETGSCTAEVTETQIGTEPAASALNETQDFTEQVSGLINISKIKFLAPVYIGWLAYDNISIENHILQSSGSDEGGNDGEYEEEELPPGVSIANSYSTDISAWAEGMTSSEAKAALGLDEIVGWSGTVASVERTVVAMRKTDVPGTDVGNIAAAFVVDESGNDWIPNSTAGLVKNFSATGGKVYISFDLHVGLNMRTKLDFLQITDSVGTSKTLTFGAHTISNPSAAQTAWGINGGVAHIDLIYDLETGECTATVDETAIGTNTGGSALNETQEFTSQVSGLADIAKIKFAAPIYTGWMAYDNISIKNYVTETGGGDEDGGDEGDGDEGDVTITDITLKPANLSVVYEQPEFFEATGFEGDTIFFINGEKLGKGDGDNKIKAPELPFGEHNLLVVCFLSDGSVKEVESKFTFAKKVLVKSYTQDFNSIYTGVERVVDDTDLSPISVSITQPSYGRVTVVSGASGKKDDGALKLESLRERTDDLYYPGLNINGYSGYNSGVATLEFDIKLNSTEADDIFILNPYLWTGKYSLTSGGAWVSYNTPSESFTEDWVHVKLTEDTVSETVSFEVDGRMLANNAPWGADAGGYYSNRTVRISSLNRRIRSEGEVYAGFTIDNFKGEVINVYTPATAEIAEGGLKISIPSGVTNEISLEHMTLKTSDGLSIETKDVICKNGGTEVFVSAELPLGKIIEVTLSKELSYADGAPFERDNVIRVETPADSVVTEAEFKIEGDRIYSAEQLLGGKTITAEISYENEGNESTELLYVLTVRKNGRLEAIASKTVGEVTPKSEGNSTLELLLPSETSDCEVFLLVCDSYRSGKMLASPIRIY